MAMRRFAILIKPTSTGFSAYSPDLRDLLPRTTPWKRSGAIFKALTAHFEAMHEVGEPIPEPSTAVDYVEVAA
jgi:predicted RNase H-like HicB family nuclease